MKKIKNLAPAVDGSIAIGLCISSRYEGRTRDVPS